MSNEPKTYNYDSLKKLAQRLRSDLKDLDFVLLYAYNGTGKTRLSMAFKDEGRSKDQHDTLYFNAFTEDLFYWDNDLENDAQRVLKINSSSRFFSGLKELELEEKIFAYIERYSDFEFKIDYDNWAITFTCKDTTNIKVSRGEENIFIWCIFLAICELAIDKDEAYNWVKYLYIDDPISSLDDNNAIAVASDLAKLLKRGSGQIKTVISSHHGLFFNVMVNELKRLKHKKYFLHNGAKPDSYNLRATDDTPFFHHVAMLSELRQASETGKLYTHHFNMLRSIMEKTATFFGFDDFSACLHGVDDDVLFARALNLLSHGKYSAFEPREMVPDTKELFQRILRAFLDRYKFQLPELFVNEKQEVKQS